MNKNRKYIVRLTEEERGELKELTTKGKAAAYKEQARQYSFKS